MSSTGPYTWQTPARHVLGTFVLTGVLALLLITSAAALVPLGPAGRLTILLAAWPPTWTTLLCWYALGVRRWIFWTLHGLLVLLWLANVVPV